MSAAGTKQREEEDDQAEALRRAPQPRDAAGREEDRGHQGGGEDRGLEQVHLRAGGPRPYDSGRDAPTDEEGEQREGSANAETPPGERQSKAQHREPRKGGVEGQEAELHRGPHRLPRVRREVEEIDASPAERVAEEPLVPGNAERQHDADCCLGGEKRQRTPRGVERGPPAPAHGQPPPFERAGEDNHQGQGGQSVKEEIGRVAKQRPEFRRGIEAARDHSPGAGWCGEPEEGAGEDQAGGNCEGVARVTAPAASQCPPVQERAAQHEHRQREDRHHERQDATAEPRARRLEVAGRDGGLDERIAVGPADDERVRAGTFAGPFVAGAQRHDGERGLEGEALADGVANRGMGGEEALGGDRPNAASVRADHRLNADQSKAERPWRDEQGGRPVDAFERQFRRPARPRDRGGRPAPVGVDRERGGAAGGGLHERRGAREQLPDAAVVGRLRQCRRRERGFTLRRTAQLGGERRELALDLPLDLAQRLDVRRAEARPLQPPARRDDDQATGKTACEDAKDRVATEVRTHVCCGQHTLRPNGGKDRGSVL